MIDPRHAVFAFMSLVTPLAAQEATVSVDPTPFFNVQTSVTPSSDALSATLDELDLEFMLAPDGQIRDLRLSAVSRQRGSGDLCVPICYVAGSNPPKTYCVIHPGCPGSGGGGGGVLMEAPLAVEFTPRPTEGEQIEAVDLRVIDLMSDSDLARAAIAIPGVASGN